MGKATELDNRRREHAEQIARGELPDPKAEYDLRPELRLGPEALARAVGPNAPVKDVLDHLADEAVSKVAVLCDSESGAIAVAVSVEQYLELVTSLIKERGLMEITTQGPLAGRAAPSEATLAELGIEQVNPLDTWLPIPGYNPDRPAS